MKPAYRLAGLSLGHGDVAEYTKNVGIISKSGTHCGVTLWKWKENCNLPALQVLFLLL